MKAIILIAVAAFLVVFLAWVSYEEYLFTKKQREEVQARNRRMYTKITFEEQHDL